jgi:hypothetical protein
VRGQNKLECSSLVLKIRFWGGMARIRGWLNHIIGTNVQNLGEPNSKWRLKT